MHMSVRWSPAITSYSPIWRPGSPRWAATGSPSSARPPPRSALPAPVIDAPPAAPRRRRSAAPARAADLATPGLIAVHALSSAAFMPLTPREHDVARRAAAGISNRQIADDLGIAERTVDNHLARCYDKLHVHTRSALRTALGLDRS